VDSGHYTEFVYEFVKRHSFGVYACKGKDWINTGGISESESTGNKDKNGRVKIDDKSE
jgi:hypothetical protein